ncbi:hypothetical protein [Vibrio penaeicida]|uniref:hypothetical protein n=1 Tax=Vibrio penaeicida TaxID=104609 RepID=UPI00142DD0BF|nr:hypothetical protein [Vibrio penaeicida]
MMLCSDIVRVKPTKQERITRWHSGLPKVNGKRNDVNNRLSNKPNGISTSTGKTAKAVD